MEEHLGMEKIINLLRKPQSGRKLVHVLTTLRKYVNGANHSQAIEMIKKCNMLKQIITFTQFDSNLHVVDLSLSILGNCCMKASVVLHVVNELNILQNLLRVIDKHKKDSIQGRVFRIFGNICDAFEPVRFLQKESKVFTVISEFLVKYSEDNDDKTPEMNYSVPTISMALRYIRKMLSVLTYHSLVHEHKLISTIGVVLIKCEKTWKLNQNNDVLINDILKILQIITSPSYKYNNLILDLKTTPHGDALQSLGEIILIQPERITKIILRLARMSKSLSDLPIVTIITILITQVEQQAHTVNGSQSHLLSCVSNLMDHLGFQDMFKNANIVKTLIKLLESYNSHEDWSINCCIYISQSLNKCKYNEELVNSQLQANIVPIIVDKLEALTGKSSAKISLQSHEKKEYKVICKRLKLDHDKFSALDVDKTERCASPSSCSDISSLGPFSPAATSNFAGDDSDSDNYSPLCSETECDEDFKDESEEIQDLAASDTDDNHPSLTQDQMELRSKLRSELCTLLKLYCSVKPIHHHLGDIKVITIVINMLLDGFVFVNTDMNVKEYSIVRAITLTHNFLIPFMISGVISQVYEVLDTPHTELCSDCEGLRCKARLIIGNFLTAGASNGIKGDIAHILLAKDNFDIKAKIALSIPYVIRKKETLVNLLLDCGGLNLLMSLLKDEKLQENSIKAICTLASTSLRIRNPVQKKTTTRKVAKAEQMIKIGDYQPKKCANEVTFILDDLSRIKADRDELNEKSDYFRALLGGCFIESKSDEVALKDVSAEALKCLLEILKTDYTSTCSFVIDYSLDAILEVLLLSDRFLLSTLNSLMMSHVQQAIAVDTVPTIYKWSIESGTNMLRVDSIAYALVNDNSYSTKLELFRCLFDIGYTVELVDDISELICQFLNRTSVC